MVGAGRVVTNVTTYLGPDVLAMVAAAADAHGLDRWLLVAQVERESSGIVGAFRFERAYRWFFPAGVIPADRDERLFQMTSWGLLQIMGATAREMGFTAPAQPWPKSPLRDDPATALDLGCRYLVKQLARCGGVMRDALSAYNAGHPTPDNFGAYVEPILERADALREAAG